MMAIFSLAVLLSSAVLAETPVTVIDAKDFEDLPASNRNVNEISRLGPVVTTRDNSFESGTISLRGLRGEGGVFPTASIVDKNVLAADYSVYFFDNDTEDVNNNFEISFGLSEHVEVGLAGNVRLVDTALQDDTFYATGPALKWRPIHSEVYQLTVGGAVRFGDSEEERNQLLFAGSYRLYEGDGSWSVRSVTLNAGMLQEWFDDRDIPGAETDSMHGFASIALGFVNDWKAVFEAGTRDDDMDEDIPYSVALSVPAKLGYKSDAIELEVVPSIVEDGRGAGPSIQLSISIRR